MKDYIIIFQPARLILEPFLNTDTSLVLHSLATTFNIHNRSKLYQCQVAPESSSRMYACTLYVTFQTIQNDCYHLIWLIYYILYPKKDKNQRVAIEGKSPVALHDYCEQDISVP